MKEKRIVVALGRNAFGETFPEQKKKRKKGSSGNCRLSRAEISDCNYPQ